MDFNFNLNISFTYFNLKYSGESCGQERVVINSSLQNTIGRYCGRRYKWSTFATSRQIKLEFHTFARSKSKFDLLYEIISKILDSYMASYGHSMEFGEIENNAFVSPFSWSHTYNLGNSTYHTWNIFVPKMYKLNLRLQKYSKLKDSLYLFDGPDVQCKLYKMANATSFLASSFQVFAILHSYEKKLQMNFESEILKTNETNFYQHKMGTKSRQTYNSILLTNTISVFNFYTVAGYYINVSIIALEYIGSDVGYCKYGGTSIYDDRAGVIKEVFLACNDVIHSSILPPRIIVSSENILSMIFYSYWPYSQIGFKISVETTQCKGVPLIM